MTALVPLTTRLRTARVAIVLPPEHSGPEAADFAAHGADLLLFSRGSRHLDECVEAVTTARNRLFGLTTLVAVDDLGVAMAVGADLVFVRRPGWRPFGYPRPHEYTLFGRPIEAPDGLGKLSGDPFVFAFGGPAIRDGELSPVVAELAAAAPPLALPAAPVWFASGGITSGNVDEVLLAGARRVAVSTAVFSAADPFAETRVIAEAVKDAWRSDVRSQAYARDAFSG